MTTTDAAPALYTASVPVLLRYLASLGRIVAIVQALPGPRVEAVLAARLAPDMIAFQGQVETAVQFARRTAFPLAGRQVPAFVPEGPGCDALRRQIERVCDELRALDPSGFAQAGDRLIAEKAGAAGLQLTGPQFLHEYALPNFFFHLGMAYAIARSQGVVLGKGVYDGFHVYPSGA